jgi:hypothetical protein
LEAFLLVLYQSHLLRLEYEVQKIVFPIDQEAKPEKLNPFPPIVEPQDVYPAEVVGRKGIFTHEKIPPQAISGGCIDVLVQEITPFNFWVHCQLHPIRRRHTHDL